MTQENQREGGKLKRAGAGTGRNIRVTEGIKEINPNLTP